MLVSLGWFSCFIVVIGSSAVAAAAVLELAAA